MHNLIQRIISPKPLFTLLVLLSLLVILLMISPDVGTLLGPNIIILWVLHAFSGLGLVILTYREKISGKPKLFLLLAGFSAVGFVLGVILHNAFYALGTLAENIIVLKTVIGFFEGVFFLIAVILCPIGLFAGVVGSIASWKKIKSPQSANGNRRESP